MKAASPGGQSQLVNFAMTEPGNTDSFVCSTNNVKFFSSSGCRENILRRRRRQKKKKSMEVTWAWMSCFLLWVIWTTSFFYGEKDSKCLDYCRRRDAHKRGFWQIFQLVCSQERQPRSLCYSHYSHHPIFVHRPSSYSRVKKILIQKGHHTKAKVVYAVPLFLSLCLLSTGPRYALACDSTDRMGNRLVPLSLDTYAANIIPSGLLLT